MNDFLSHDVKKFQKRRARRRVWHSVLTVLASVVVFATTYALILPAITMTAVHVHDESCYTQVTTTEKEILACPVSAESGLVVVHRHDSRCYDEDGMLACPLPELAAHTHTADCYEYPEAHVHTDACYSEERGELICGLEEGEEHTRTIATRGSRFCPAARRRRSLPSLCSSAAKKRSFCTGTTRIATPRTERLPACFRK